MSSQIHSFNIPKKIALISTGGTIEKTYDEISGTLGNGMSVLEVILDRLELRGIEIEHIPLMNKDSLEMTVIDHTRIAQIAHQQAARKDGVIIVHGTDRLTKSGDAILEKGIPSVPVILTGAMRPYLLRTTDAVQNLTEALVAVQICGPGVFAAFHSRILSFPGVMKDYENMTFCYDGSERRGRERRYGERRKNKR